MPDPKPLAFTTLLLATLAWSLSPIFIRQLSVVFDPITLTFIRYAVALVPLTIVSWVRFRADYLVLLRSVQVTAPLATLTVVQQYTWVAGTYGATATTAQLITKLTVPFTIFFAFFLFHEERAAVRHPLFVFGVILSLAGMAAVLTKDAAAIRPTVDAATALLITTAILWAVYNVWSKFLVMNVHPVPLFGVIALYVTAAFGIGALVWGESSDWAGFTPGLIVVWILSGIFPLAMAHPCYNFAQRYLGSSYCTTFVLITPLITWLLSFIMLPGEQLLMTQIIGGVVLMLGTFFVTLAHLRATAHAAPPSVPIVGEPTVAEQRLASTGRR